MPKSRRVQVTLSDDAFEVLEELKEIQGRSLSAIVGEFINSGLPELKRVIEMLKAAQLAKETGKAAYIDELKRTLGDQMVEVGSAVSDLQKAIEAAEKPSESK